MTNDEMLKATSGRDTGDIKPLDINELYEKAVRLDLKYATFCCYTVTNYG